jgi:hypothetical protein
MNSRSNQGRRQRRYTGRHQARLDPETSAKLEDLASTCHRKRSAILRFVMQWGLHHSEGWTVDQSPVVAVPPVPVLLEPELLQQVQDAAAAHGVSTAAWLCEALLRITVDDFPASWRTGEMAGRSHEPAYFHRKFGMRLDAVTSRKLEAFMERYLAGEVEPDAIDDFVEEWHEGKYGVSLAEFLGLSDDEYWRWVKDANALPDIRAEREVKA